MKRPILGAIRGSRLQLPLKASVHSLPRQSKQPNRRVKTSKARYNERVKLILYLRMYLCWKLNLCLSFWLWHKRTGLFEKVLFYQVSYQGQHFEIALRREQVWCIVEHKHFKFPFGNNLFFFSPFSVVGNYAPLLFNNH